MRYFACNETIPIVMMIIQALQNVRSSLNKGVKVILIYLELNVVDTNIEQYI